MTPTERNQFAIDTLPARCPGYQPDNARRSTLPARCPGYQPDNARRSTRNRLRSLRLRRWSWRANLRQWLARLTTTR